MYIRGVGNLRSEPRNEYGLYATFNDNVVDSILVCAVRSAYETLIEQLKHSFAVTVMDGFDFVTREEMVDIDPFSHRTATRRVVSWSLENASPAFAGDYEQDRADIAKGMILMDLRSRD